ncbi:hypothetical protein BKA63DRAFT_582159 [Paraphoma chrysanthemicola]|nr:hypothetical protein BKA63DRAFT_582159 [Paraphoma chrysanthemicola]
MTFGPPDHLTLYDRSLSGLPYTRLPSCYSDSEPDLFFSRQSPDLSLTTSGFSCRLQDPRLTCDRNLKWSIDWAVAYIVDHLEKRPEAADALRSIRIRAATFEHEGLTKDIPYRIFNKLNETLFASYLKDAVFLGSSSLGPEVSGVTYTHSWGPVTEVRRVSFILNSDVLDYARARDVVAILIHHMIHAYFLVACGPQKENEVDYGRLGHGYHFAKVMSTIRKVSAAHGKELTPLNFGHDLASLPSHEDIYDFPRRRSSLDDRENKEKWYCSHCHSNVYEIPESDIDKWYNKVCKPMMDQASKNIRAAESVEFIFQDKPVLVEGKKIDNFLAVRRAFENKKSRFLKIDKEVSEKTFHRFLEFIHTCTYRPDPYNLRAVAVGMGITSMGPPIIRPGGGRSEAWLLADVQFAKMGALMRFDECKAYALGRMNAYGTMTEDPLDVLKEIYSGYEPDSRLKEWARKFLIATPTPSPASSDYIGTRNITPSELPNLLKLEDEQGPYQARLREAMEASGALENDVRKAWQELKNAGWMDYGTLSATYPALDLDRLRALERIKIRNERENDKRGELAREMERERERDRLRETHAQVQAAAMLERFYGRGLEGYVLDDDEWY